MPISKRTKVTIGGNIQTHNNNNKKAISKLVNIQSTLLHIHALYKYTSESMEFVLLDHTLFLFYGIRAAILILALVTEDSLYTSISVSRSGRSGSN